MSNSQFLSKQEFILDSKLKKDSIYIMDGKLSEIRLMNDNRYPWFILVPKVANISELIDLSLPQQHILLDEINMLSRLLKNQPIIEKINIATLGNVVKQLHIHIIGRHSTDAAWSAPVWGQGNAVIYTHKQQTDIILYWKNLITNWGDVT